MSIHIWEEMWPIKNVPLKYIDVPFEKKGKKKYDINIVIDKLQLTAACICAFWI